MTKLPRAILAGIHALWAALPKPPRRLAKPVARAAPSLAETGRVASRMVMRRRTPRARAA